MSGTSANRRRRRAHELRGQGHSLRTIARELDQGKSTIARWLAQPVPELQVVPNLHDEDGRPVAGAEEANTRALRHGANSEQRVAPLRAKHAALLRHDFDWLDDRRLELLADRLARIESAAAWIDEQGGVVRDDQGEVFPVVDRADKWASAAERVLADLHAEARERRAQPHGSLAQLAAELEAEDEQEEEGA